ncbi:UDP-glucose 4-epimerase GalE [Exiguobacterium sp. UBA3968]|uniref:UDP-glucose 4-epimerase GalE n=1 Tax=Exiguobacterium sp. UBA3968 TaxID=1946492 RepID=UPI0025C366A7|nr:UDP-glucose 4-epimerase GalE [Exiguobacterium sp. UBA3968]
MILLTGMSGYIGSHTAIKLIESNFDIIGIDNFSNSSKESINRVNKITNKKIHVEQIDLLNATHLNEIFSKYNIEAVIHFAGLKAVGESVEKPLEYYINNVTGTLNLLDVMKKYNVKTIVFSSSATVYGDPKEVPIDEGSPLTTTNPYGTTKLMIEQILKDLANSDSEWNITVLRYFNPIGAHSSGLIGEDPSDKPNNLMPYISQVAVGKLPKLQVFGDDYPTKDGTGVRDYIHVEDLAVGHVKAVQQVLNQSGHNIYNLGTGNGYSVLEMIKAFEKAASTSIPFEIVDRRSGDIATCFADPTKAKNELNWSAEKTLHDMCRDSWNWQRNNPNGYSK